MNDEVIRNYFFFKSRNSEKKFSGNLFFSLVFFLIFFSKLIAKFFDWFSYHLITSSLIINSCKLKKKFQKKLTSWRVSLTTTKNKNRSFVPFFSIIPLSYHLYTLSHLLLSLLINSKSIQKLGSNWFFIANR